MEAQTAAGNRLQELRRGWPTLLGGSLGLAFGFTGLTFYTLGIFIKPFQAEFGWTLSQLSAVPLAMTLVLAFAAPVAGSLIDRLGVRVPAALSMIAIAIGFAATGLMQGSFGIYVAIQLLMAFFAAAATPISYSRAVNGRFNSARGLALGLTLCGTGLAGAFGPPIVSDIVASEGWRTAFFKMAVVVLCATPIVFLLLGRRPTVSVADPVESESLGAVTVPFFAMIGDAAFRRLALTFFVLALGITGFVLHMVPMLTDKGVPLADAARVQAWIGIAVLVGRVGIGALVDHFFAPRVAAIALCGTIAGIVALAVVGPAVAPVAAFAIGFALGAEVDLIGYLTVRYFGLQGYGRRYGVLFGIYTLGSGMSPLLIAVIAEQAGGYVPALWASAGCVAVAALLLATAPRFPQVVAE
jgi:OFA family oxalate/formate antiporter-like MFS transporter